MKSVFRMLEIAGLLVIPITASATEDAQSNAVPVGQQSKAAQDLNKVAWNYRDDAQDTAKKVFATYVSLDSKQWSMPPAGDQTINKIAFSGLSGCLFLNAKPEAKTKSVWDLQDQSLMMSGLSGCLSLRNYVPTVNRNFFSGGLQSSNATVKLAMSAGLSGANTSGIAF